MNVLVVGGTGLIGSHAARALAERGHSVAVMARRAPSPHSPVAKLEFLEGDYMRRPPTQSLLGRFDGVVFATGMDWRIQPAVDAQGFFDNANVQCVAKFFGAAAQAGVRRGVLVSSFYPVVRPELHDQPYIRSRLMSEQAVFDACAGAMTVCAVEPSWVMGPTVGIDTSFGETITKLVRSGWPPIAIRGGTNWVSARSLGVAIAAALVNGRDGARYLVGDENRSWAEVVSQFAKHAGNRRQVVVLPNWLVHTVGLCAYVRRRLKGAQSGWDERRFTAVMTDAVYFNDCSGQELNYPRNQIDGAILETYETCSAQQCS